MNLTFSETYGDIPRRTLQLFGKCHVSPCDYDMILMHFGWNWGSPAIDWPTVHQHVMDNSTSGYYKPYGAF